MKNNAYKAGRSSSQRVSTTSPAGKFLRPVKRKGVSYAPLPYNIFKEMPDFFTIGVGSTLLDWATYGFLLVLGAPYLLAVSVAFLLGAALNFYGNRGFTFVVKDKAQLRAGMFILIAASAWLFTVVLLRWLMGVFQPDIVFWKIVLRIMVTIIIFVYNYFMHKYITFRSW